MLTLKDVMTTDPLTLDPGMTLREAVELLSDPGVSGAPVVAGDELVGVLSMSDILEFHSTHPGTPSRREHQQDWGDWGPAEDWDEGMSEPPAAFFREMWADSAADLVERMADPESPEWDVLSERRVGELMTRQVFSLPPDTDITQAAAVMVERRIHRLIVTDDSKLVGIVSTMDFVRAVAEGRLQPVG